MKRIVLLALAVLVVLVSISGCYVGFGIGHGWEGGHGESEGHDD